MSEQECLTADWQTIGYADGQAAKQPAEIDRHNSACMKYGIKPDQGAYERGATNYLYKKMLGQNIQGINSEITAIDQKIADLLQNVQQKMQNKEYSLHAAVQADTSKIDKFLYLGNTKLLKYEIKEKQKEIEQLEERKSELLQQNLTLQQEINTLDAKSLSTGNNLFGDRQEERL